MPPIVQFLLTSSYLWFSLYAVITCLLSVFSCITLHMTIIGLFICLLSFIKLPSPDPQHVRDVLQDLSYVHRNTIEAGEIVAHRAACIDAPENSIEAVTAAVAAGVKWIEFDVSFTRDNVAVVFHDDDVDRVTDGSGPITDLTFAQLMKLNLIHPNFHGAKVATVEKFVEECLKHNINEISSSEVTQKLT